MKYYICGFVYFIICSFCYFILKDGEYKYIIVNGNRIILYAAAILGNFVAIFAKNHFNHFDPYVKQSKKYKLITSFAYFCGAVTLSSFLCSFLV